MGSCCSRSKGESGQSFQPNQVTKNAAERARHWTATGSIGLRDANLRELPDSRLLLSNNQLLSLPPSLSGLKGLKVLALDDNTLISLPDSIGELSKLERLSVAGNTLSELPHSIGQLGRLVELNVARNKLTALPSSLGSCGKLENIDAADNYLKSIPEELGQAKKLKLLKLDQNRIGAIPETVLEHCASLQTLSLHSNPITPEALQGTAGFEAFEKRRQSKASKAIASGVLLGDRTMDAGVG
ncbi:hypothetical protein WJX73_004521 [Symbiochloris irregularis]|uniref:Disease resistance R13L4/SHOC-2-like LRR domain-containing protein n=1 Tax=Symbiochloris irregularis TaxID=706552 RepID=A0AAW1PRC8_9CHLO